MIQLNVMGKREENYGSRCYLYSISTVLREIDVENWGLQEPSFSHHSLNYE
jgi:hypothetical protein